MFGLYRKNIGNSALFLVAQLNVNNRTGGERFCPILTVFRK